MGKAKKIYKANKEIALRNYEQSLNRFYSQQFQNKADKELRDESAKDRFRQDMQIREQREDAKLEAFEQSERTFVDQLIYNEKAEQEALAGEEKVFNERILATSFEADAVNLGFQRQVMQSKFEYDTIGQKFGDALTDFTSAEKLLDEQTDLERDQVKNRREALTAQRTQLKANEATEQYKNRIQSLRDEGVSRARGRRGRTAERSLQSIQALAGVNSKLIADRLTKSEAIISKEQEILDKQLGLSGGHQAGKGYITRLKDARRQILEDRKKQQRNLLTRQENLVTESLGITTKQFEMTREQLGKSLLSAAESYEKRVDSIQQQKFAADLNAYARRQLSPRVSPEIPEPFETRIPITIKPPKPVKPVKSNNANMMQQDTNPVVQGIAGVASTVSAIGFATGNPVVGGVAAGVGILATTLDKIF